MDALNESDSRVALVTGANRGIGLATVRGLAERGYTTLRYARDLAKGKRAAAELARAGVRALPSELLTTALAWARPRQELVAEDLLLRHQLPVLTRSTRTRPRARLHIRDKLLWVLARQFCAGWREHLRIVTPDTVVRWHPQGWRLFWRWKSRSRGGRPHLSPEV